MFEDIFGDFEDILSKKKGPEVAPNAATDEWDNDLWSIDGDGYWKNDSPDEWRNI